MPRSSGGGSHSSGYSSSSGSSRSYSSGGGSHSGGYSSSSSYSSSSYGSSGYSGSSYRNSYSSGKSSRHNKPAAKVSRKEFSGSRRYVYYADSGPKYYYSDYETTTRKKHRRLIFWIPFLILIAAGLFAAVQPAALSTDYDTEIIVADNMGLINDADSLYAALEEFRNATGITPCIVTVSNEEWGEHYDSLYAFAFDMYVNSFEDEKHWLIAYSQPVNPDPGFNDWFWEGVQGDDTVNILTDKAADDFGISLQKYLTSNRYTVGEAFTMAFSAAAPVIMENASVDGYELFAAVLIFGLLAWLGIKRTDALSKAPERPKGLPVQANPVKRSAKEIKCEYCDGVYLSDSLKCPYCGAGRQPIN